MSRPRALCSFCGRLAWFPVPDAIGFGPYGWGVNGDTYVCGARCEREFNRVEREAGERMTLFLPTLEAA